MKKPLVIAILIGIILGMMMFPMIIIPAMGIGISVWSIYLLIHDIIPGMLHQDHDNA